jgi:serine/threonine protein kinase
MANERPHDELDPGENDAPEKDADATVDDEKTLTERAGAANPTRQREELLNANPFATETLPRRLGGFELQKILGEGSSGKVYLATDLSLERSIALKVSAESPDEARTMASLEHNSIVQVFSQETEPATGNRLLCMQYVAGTTLEHTIRELGKRSDPPDGQALLEIVDELSQGRTLFDPSEVRHREELAQCDHYEAVCWLGAQLAEALAYAHSHGVIHRDVKPANVLLNPHGRPLLADFSVAFDSGRRLDTRARLGGTLIYMAPEHIDALVPGSGTPPEQVNERSDLYSLGIVLFELACGSRPFRGAREIGNSQSLLQEMINERLSGPPRLKERCPDVPPALERTILRCLAPDPEHRFSDGESLARVLQEGRRLGRIEKQLRPQGFVDRGARSSPWAWLFLLAVTPHVIGSIINIAYNGIHIVEVLTEQQRELFTNLVLGYNVVLYPLCLFSIVWLVRRPISVWRRLNHFAPVALEDVESARKQVLRTPPGS